MLGIDNVNREDIFKSVLRERQEQDDRWGDTHDDDLFPGEWTYLIHKYSNLAEYAQTDAERRKRLVQVAALAVAAIESHERLKAK